MAHTWRFVRAGGFDQVKLTSGQDLVSLGDLDQKLWVALACPVKGLEFDAQTLALIDSDNDDRVRASELIEASSWVGGMLSDVSILEDGRNGVRLSDVDASSEDGKLLHDAMVRVLKDLGATETGALTVADADKARAAFNATPFNGDGVIVEASADGNEGLAATIRDILSCAETPATDRSGEPGVDAAMAESFFAEVAERAAWLDAGDAEGVQPLGESTADAYAALTAIQAKIDDFFARCRIAAFDERALEAVNREQSEYLAIAAKDLQVTADEIAHFPIAMVEPGKELPLTEGVNPAWAGAVDALRSKVLEPLLGEAPTALSEEQWGDVKGRFGAFEAWTSGEAAARLGGLAAARIRELQAPAAAEAVTQCIERDAAAAPQSAAIESVERLVRYVRDLMALANNFVAFRDFYARSGPAMFQAGTLYIDQRACELCLVVNDAGKHAKMGPMASAYLLYCDLKNAAGKKQSIVAAVTDGDVDNLMVGRNGVFYDRKGDDWDATVTKVVENPISIRQAFWSPYKRFLRAIEGLVASRAEAAESASAARVDAAAAQTDKAAKGETTEKPSTFDVGTVAALGVAVGGITAALGALLQAFFGLGIWMPLGVLGLILLISGPSMAVAWLKLRQRNLGPLLDANGWAVNAQAKLNVPLGKSLTQVAKLPAGSSRDLRDPYAERRTPWGLFVFLVLLIVTAGSWYIGSLDAYLPPPAKSTTVLGELAPAAVASPDADEKSQSEEKPAATETTEE